MTIKELKKQMGLASLSQQTVLHPQNMDDMCYIYGSTTMIPYWMVKKLEVPDERIISFQSKEEYDKELDLYNQEQERLKKIKEERDATMPWK